MRLMNDLLDTLTADGDAVVVIDGLFSTHPGELTISMTAKANWS
jgi:hypothetical protein